VQLNLLFILCATKSGLIVIIIIIIITGVLNGREITWSHDFLVTII